MHTCQYSVDSASKNSTLKAKQKWLQKHKALVAGHAEADGPADAEPEASPTGQLVGRRHRQHYLRHGLVTSLKPWRLQSCVLAAASVIVCPSAAAAVDVR